MTAETKIDTIRTKLNRWQKMLDNTYNQNNPVVQQARDAVMQSCIDTIREIIDSK